MPEDKVRAPEGDTSGSPQEQTPRPTGQGGEAVGGAHVRPGDPGHAAYPLSEVDYWREAHGQEPYYEAGRGFEEYSTAYELGWVSYHLYGGEFDTADRVLANDWLVRKGVSTLSWEQARPACRAAWQRAENARCFVTDGSASAEDVREVLGDLFVTARDGELGFREAAGHARAPELVRLFERLAEQCAACASHWQAQIASLGGAVDENGTVGGAAHRAWLQVRGLFGGASDEALLSECERGQEELLEHYRQALRRNLPRELHAAVQRQFEHAQRQHDHFKRLRDRARAAEANPEQPVERSASR